MVNHNSPAAPVTWQCTTDSSPAMTERLLNACGQIGVKMHARAVGNRIGPPALNEYAVEPVGVAKIMPSHTYSVNNSPSIDTRSRTILDTAPREMTASLSAR